MGLRKWNDEKIGLLKKYWYSKTNTEIAAILGVKSITVSKKARSIGLYDKRKMSRDKNGIWHKPDYVPKSKEVKEYRPRYDAIKEIRGRQITEKLEYIKKSFKVGEVLNLIDYESGNPAYESFREHLTPKKKHGKVICITNSQVAVKRENYTECFKYVDMLSGRTIVEGLNVCQ